MWKEEFIGTHSFRGLVRICGHHGGERGSRQAGMLFEQSLRVYIFFHKSKAEREGGGREKEMERKKERELSSNDLGFWTLKVPSPVTHLLR